MPLPRVASQDLELAERCGEQPPLFVGYTAFLGREHLNGDVIGINRQGSLKGIDSFGQSSGVDECKAKCTACIRIMRVPGDGGLKFGKTFLFTASVVVGEAQAATLFLLCLGQALYLTSVHRDRGGGCLVGRGCH